MFGGNFAPTGWMLCEGQLLDIASNEVLFALLGTTYGGDGQTTFALPDLRGRLPIHQGGGYVIGGNGGTENITLTVNQIPAHAHAVLGTSADADRRNPKGALLARPRDNAYTVPGTVTPMNPSASGSAGGSQPHSNLQPYLCVNFIISLFGIFPSQN